MADFQPTEEQQAVLEALPTGGNMSIEAGAGTGKTSTLKLASKAAGKRKNVVYLVYEGENHSLAKRPNQLDYAHRLRHFFDVYLKGMKAEPWVTDGVPFLKKDQ